jgi:phosphopantetheine adenylyltransferase
VDELLRSIYGATLSLDDVDAGTRLFVLPPCMNDAERVLYRLDDLHDVVLLDNDDTRVACTRFAADNLVRVNRERDTLGLAAILLDDRRRHGKGGVAASECVAKEMVQEALTRYTVACVGGTFDHIHVGHKILLTMAALMSSDAVVMGVTGDAMLVNKRFRDAMESYDARRQAAERMIALVNPALERRVAELADPFGPSIVAPDITLLVVSAETQGAAPLINGKREAADLKQCDVFVIGLIADDGDGGKLSSTAIRQRLMSK